MKPFYSVPINECGESLVAIEPEKFALVSPHPYQKLGAPYGGKSPFFVRESVLTALMKAQDFLQESYPLWSLQIFDAYRPVSVQQFMVDYSFEQLLEIENLKAENLTEFEKQEMMERVYEFWARPSLDLATPPPHSTGAAVDVTLVDETGEPVNMGSPIDEISPRSFPDHFAESCQAEEMQYHSHRSILKEAMLRAGFCQHPSEWWHFCLGDQMWAWLSGESCARYGRVE